MEELWGEPKSGNVVPLVTTTALATGNLLHTLPTGRTCKITKICAYNTTGADLPLLFGTHDRAVAPALVQLLPDLRAISLLDNEWTEWGLPAVEFASDLTPLAAGRTGDIYVLAGTVAAPVAGVIVVIEVREKGA